VIENGHNPVYERVVVALPEEARDIDDRLAGWEFFRS